MCQKGGDASSTAIMRTFHRSRDFHRLAPARPPPLAPPPTRPFFALYYHIASTPTCFADFAVDEEQNPLHPPQRVHKLCLGPCPHRARRRQTRMKPPTHRKCPSPSRSLHNSNRSSPPLIDRNEALTQSCRRLSGCAVTKK